MYSNSKNQISLEEAYRKVHSDDNVTEENVDAIDYGLRTAHQIVADTPDGLTDITRLLPVVIGAATVALGLYKEQAAELVDRLMSKINIPRIKQEVSPLEQKQKELAAAAKHNMEKQVELNKVEDELLEQIVMKGIDQIYHSGNGIGPSHIVGALKKELEKRISSRK